MLGTTRSLVVATAVLLPAATSAVAATPGVDFWQAKLSKTATLSITRADGMKATTATISYSCKSPDTGQISSFEAQLTGKSKGNSFKAKGKAFSTYGKASIDATLKTSGATGKAKVDYSDFAPTCKLSKSFKAKYTHATGG